MAFASPDLHLAFGRWPAIAVSVRSAISRLPAIRPIVLQLLNTMTAVVVASRQLSPRSELQAARASVAPPRQLTLAEQWSKISGVLVRSVDGARVANQMQTAATQQLDLAQYGLITLVDELSAVMTLPGRHSRTATVHVLNGVSGNDLGQGHALAA